MGTRLLALEASTAVRARRGRPVNVVAALAHNAAARRGPRVKNSQHSLLISCDCAYGSMWARQFAVTISKAEI
jgi:hypothetical protein